MKDEKEILCISIPFFFLLFIFLFTIQPIIMLVITIGVITTSTIQYYNDKSNLDKSKQEKFKNDRTREKLRIEELENELEKEKNEKENILKMKIGEQDIKNYIQENFKHLSPKYNPKELQKINKIRAEIKSRFKNNKINNYDTRSGIQIIDDYYEFIFLEEYINKDKLLDIIEKLLINISKNDIIEEYINDICDSLEKYGEKDKIKLGNFLKLKLTKFVFQY